MDPCSPAVAVSSASGPAGPETHKPTAPAVLLGLFIVWQVIHIVGANLLDLYPHRVHRLDEVTAFREHMAGSKSPYPTVHALASINDGWAELTGQYQQWWLFAPDFPAQSVFPLVELRWDDPATGQPPVQLGSCLEPRNTASYCHPFTSTDRLLHYECNLCLGFNYWNPSAEQTDPAMWRKFHLDYVQSQWKSMRAYLRWRAAEYLASHPELPPPDEVRLLVRVYPTPAAADLPGRRALPIDRPYARWRCAENCPPGMLPVDAFEQVSGRFVSLPLPPEQQPAVKIAQAFE